MTGLRRALASGGAVLAIAGSAFAADQIAGRDRAPAAAAVTIDTTAPLFDEAGLVNGQQLERCTVLTNEGPQPADVTLFGEASVDDLSPWLEFELVRGTLPPGTPAGDCTGFAADPADYGAGDVGVVFRGTLADLPNADDGIADPTRWAVGERHAYLLRIDYTGDDPQQGLSTVQNFMWGATPFDDRPPEPDPGTIPGGEPGDTPTTPDGTTPSGTTSDESGPAAVASIGGTGVPTGTAPGGTTIPVARQCRVISFPARAYIGARAISRPVKVSRGRKTQATSPDTAAAQPLTSTEPAVVAAAPDAQRLGDAEIQRRQNLLTTTRRSARGSTARRSPVLVVRLSPGKNDTLAVRVGLRKNAKMTSPRRWKWVRIRVNSTATKSTLTWPFTATAKMEQLKVGYNQLDLTLNRGVAGDRVNGLPRLMRRSFAFVVGEPTTTTPGGTTTECTLG